MVIYIPIAVLDSIFSYVKRRYAHVEEVPQYAGEPRFDEFLGILQQVQTEYYPDLLDKAVFLLISINKGHFFSNGNKRLALAIMAFFLGANRRELNQSLSKDDYKNILQVLFPEYALWEDHQDFSATEFATYNLSIVIADSGVYDISHDELKKRTRSFLEHAIVDAE